MAQIRLLYIENSISRKNKTQQQTLRFFMWVENLSYEKQVEVFWAGEDGRWQGLSAQFHANAQDGGEYWLAECHCLASPAQSLPGNIQFGLRYRVLGGEYWDNQQGNNYLSQADSGVLLAQNQAIQHLAFTSRLQDQQKFIPVTIAVNAKLAVDKVNLHWTTDNWRHSKITACHFRRNYWDKTALSNARNPNQYGVQIWQAWLRVGKAFTLEYSISYECAGQVFWDNNAGNNYCYARKPLSLMILNLHCYQEANQDEKFNQIAKAINELDVDMVCLQEVAELWNNGNGDWQSNAARIINERLPTPFYIHTDWSHLGFDRYREGVAILSRYPMCNHDARYVSDSHDAFSIHSRKVVMAEITVPFLGAVNVFSAHLSWWEDGFAGQFQRLQAWAAEKHGAHVNATLLCGDFNVAVGSPGYRLAVAGGRYDDQFLAANGNQLAEQNFRQQDPYWQSYNADDYRIDYVFMNKGSELKAVSARVLFTEGDYGRVSDHNGYLLVFAPK